MIVKTQAIVLRNINYSETSVICKMYTRELGIRSYMINGVRKAKAKVSMAMLQPLSILELETYEKPNAGIQRIKELKNSPLLVQIGQDFRKRSVALFLVELLNACLLAEDGDPPLFDFLHRQVLLLETGQEVSNFSLLFMVQLAEQLGIEPQGAYSSDTPYFDLSQASFVLSFNEHCLSKRSVRIIGCIEATRGMGRTHSNERKG